MIEKLHTIDEILARYEDWMHGKDGQDCTIARKLISEICKELKKKIEAEPVQAQAVRAYSKREPKA